MLKKDDIGFIKRHALFSDFSDQQFNKLAAFLIPSVHSQGAVIFRQGDTADGLYIIQEGKVDIFRSGPQPGQGDFKVNSLTKGHILGEFSLIYEGNRLTTAIVSENSFLIQFPRDDFNQLVKQDPIMGMTVMKGLARRCLDPIYRNPDLYLLAWQQMMSKD